MGAITQASTNALAIWTGETGKGENQVKPIKMFGLAALAALLAMAFVSASSAMALTTQLCPSDPTSEMVSEESCKAVTHVHETTLSGAKANLLSSIINVTCDVLFLGDVLGTSGEPLIIHGHFTYTNCNNGSCTVTEVSSDALIEGSATGHDTGSVTGEGEVNVHCGFFINCTYNGEGLEGTGKGPLLSSETNGSVTLTGQETSRVSGFCPESAFLDITTTPLSAGYILGGLHYCVEYEHSTNGFYNNNTCTEGPVAGRPYDLVIGPAGKVVGQAVCVRVPAGLWKKRTSGVCEEDTTLTGGLYEKGTIRTVQ